MKFNVVRFDFAINKVFDDMLHKAENIHLNFCRYADSDAVSLAHLKSAHIYHVSAARDEVPQQWHARAPLLDQCPDLLCVSTSGAGYDTVDVDACTQRGIVVLNQSGCNADSVAEHAIGLMLAVKHRVAESDRIIRAGLCSTRENLMGHEIRGLTLGLIGLGNTGSKVALLAKAFGMNVLAYDPNLNADEVMKRGANPSTFEHLVEHADIVSVHCPRSDETVNLFNAQVFSKMKRGAAFISTARGGIHDEAALFEAMKTGHISGAGLDVWAIEPPAKTHPLLSLPNVIATYHTAGVTHEARFNAAKMGAEQIIGLLEGLEPPRIINPQAWPTFKKNLARKLL
jgi:D-3-phosphoglycerate dehydrogenase / 2-oxoglutarate reductase